MRQLVKFAIGGIAFLSCLQEALSAQALTYQFTWTGNDSYSATGDFSFNNVNNDDFARSIDNEFTTFNITFRDNSSNPLATYNLNQMQIFNPAFNFNYDIVNDLVLQSGNSNTLTGFSVGDGDFGFLLNTSAGSEISFGNNDFSISDFGGTLTATSVPFEFSQALSLGILGAAFAIQKGRKRLQVTKKVLPQLEKELS
jgi:hypothetical protein